MIVPVSRQKRASGANAANSLVHPEKWRKVKELGRESRMVERRDSVYPTAVFSLSATSPQRGS
jgi:hypothetical protein